MELLFFFFYKKRICTGPEMIPTTNDPQFRVGDHFGVGIIPEAAQASKDLD